MKAILSLLLSAPLVLFADWVSPDQALEKLLEGNRRYVNEAPKFTNRSAERRLSTIEGQSPFAIVVACSDSRGSPDIIFDQGIGDLFVVRVAGNVIGPIELASIEFATLYLKSSLVLVLGHQNCGAIKAVLEGKSKDFEPVADLISPSVTAVKQRERPTLEAVTKENSIRFANMLRQNPILAKEIADKHLKVLGAYYDITTGKVEILKD